MRIGKVYLIGAGPGDPGLLTIYGKACLEKADVVLYDHLANPALLDYAPSQAERIYVGRCGRGAYRPQEEIHRLLIQKVQEGKQVVRLKGGDPFVFGRGGEEAEMLAEQSVPFEIVPGVTSAVAVPAYAGIPVTHRTLASTVTFVTGHEDPSKGGTVLEWPRLATVDGTLVFLMGAKNLPTIVHRLMEEGKSGDTPIALIQWGTYPKQRTVVGMLSDIVAKAEVANIQPPTIIVIGQVVQLREHMNWFESRPLFGARILVTRARSQAFELSRLLLAYGGEPVECPTIEFLPPDNWKSADDAIGHLDTFQWLVLTSVNGVQHFMRRLWHLGRDARSLHGMRVCCIGPRTAEELEKFGVQADVVPSKFQAEGILEVMKKAGVAGQRVLIARAAQAREILPEELRRLGAEVQVVSVYQTVIPQAAVDAIVGRLRSQEIEIITFASSSTVRNFVELFGGMKELKKNLQHTIIGCIGPITAETARELGLQVDVVAGQNTIPALVEALVEYRQRQTRATVSS
ncbi:uroporphyrinogen-III C-methyltransferase [Candidatus Nitronereus thalassa]|uniref:uroporphyrinogen-III C-methyltransferase n=1 Tax=Candidatus Nitronereus thalassa TaxID=3020898 RepID=A0ABU3KCR6_9BACT|nr:uroporphyrinogen-III C-methyltransferase [Candidatus Nitronereus thalassa]MDT7044254.1 uroporphyrinogen-III C-methyltransferase [Candidatus Nitronereus thalassa]